MANPHEVDFELLCLKAKLISTFNITHNSTSGITLNGTQTRTQMRKNDGPHINISNVSTFTNSFQHFVSNKNFPHLG